MKTLTKVVFKNAKRREKISKDSKLLSIISFLIVFGSLATMMVFASIYITNRLKEFNQTFAFVNMMFFANFGILFIKPLKSKPPERPLPVPSAPCGKLLSGPLATIPG